MSSTAARGHQRAVLPVWTHHASPTDTRYVSSHQQLSPTTRSSSTQASHLTPHPPAAVPNPDQSQIVCNGCRVLLSYPRGAQSVQCSLCHTVTQVRNASAGVFERQSCQHAPPALTQHRTLQHSRGASSSSSGPYWHSRPAAAAGGLDEPHPPAAAAWCCSSPPRRPPFAAGPITAAVAYAPTCHYSCHSLPLCQLPQLLALPCGMQPLFTLLLVTPAAPPALVFCCCCCRRLCMVMCSAPAVRSCSCTRWGHRASSAACATT
jgi:LSD1 subclass zinc finger protein